MSKKVRRLFEGFHPQNYKISIHPDRDTMRLSGSVTITGQKIGRPSQRITFHQHGLKITSAKIVRHDKKAGQQVIDIDRINHHNSLDEVRLHTAGPLYAGRYEVTLEYVGEITRPMDGVYPCFFTHDGQEKKLIATQFESHHAREAFPCIDEPEAKATFDLTLTSPANEATVANTPVKDQTTEGENYVTTFETTPKMSTYLLAFVFGDLKYLEAKTKDGVVVRTYATPDNVQFTDFALEAAVKCLEVFSEYYDIPYPLGKCDLIALPDFAAGAMENWGCITFREHGLILDPANSTLPTKQYIVSVIAHELAHQWFGNLVTMRWWNDLWLNEGFASWMSYLASDALHPEWEVWTQFVVDEQQAALKLDALQNTHPIEVTINHPDEISSIFDAISYEKGASVIQMLAHYLGPNAFRDGLRHYLKKHLYGNTITTDLWASLEEISGKPVTEFMSKWIGQAGYPIVKATMDKGQFNLQQMPFIINPLSETRKAYAAGETSPLWPIPLHTTENADDIMKTTTTDGRISGEPPQFKLNREQTGFYRTVYDQKHTAELAKLVKAGKLSPLDRLGLLNDAFEAAKAGYGSTVSALQLMDAYRSEDNDVVWDVMLMNLNSIRACMDDDTVREAMKPYGRDLVAKQVARLGWKAKESDSHFDKLLRPTVLSVAAISDDQAVNDEALRQFNAMTKPEDIDPDMRSLVYSTAARLGDEKTFDRLLALHNSSTSNEEQVTIAGALTYFKQPEIIRRALDLITTDTVRLQDIMYWVAYSFSNRFAREMTWEWMTSHWEWLGKSLGTDLAFHRMPLYSARSFSDANFLPKYKAFFDGVHVPALERSIKQGTEMIEWQSEWRKRELKPLQEFFTNYR